MLVKIVDTVVSTDSAGRPVDAIPIREWEEGETSITGVPLAALEIEESDVGVPVRFVVGKTAQNSAGQWIDTIPTTGGGGQLAWITNRNDLPFNAISITTAIYNVSRNSFWTGDRAIRRPRFGFANWYLDTSGAEIVGTLTPYTVVGHSIHWDGQAALFKADNHTLAAGDTYEGEPFDCIIPANTQYWVTTQITYQTSGVRPVQYYYSSTRLEGGSYSTSLSTITDYFTGAQPYPVGVVAFNGVGPAYGYGEIVGAPIPSPCIIGDSIGATGIDDNPNADGGNGLISGGDAKFNRGYLRRALHGIKGYPTLGLGRFGGNVENGYGATFAKRKAILQKASTHIISQLGQNNVFEGEATLKTKVDAMLAEYLTYGLPIVQCDLCPRSTSLDGWATLGAQTALQVALRDNMHAFYLAKVGTDLLGVLTPSSGMSPSPLSDWRYQEFAGETPMSDDGTHPNHFPSARGAIAVAAQLPF